MALRVSSEKGVQGAQPVFANVSQALCIACARACGGLSPMVRTARGADRFWKTNGTSTVWAAAGFAFDRTFPGKVVRPDLSAACGE